MRGIHFIPINEDKDAPHPVSAKKIVPKWYKEAELDYSSDTGETLGGLKRCLPFLDGLMSGYVLLTWVDIHIKKNENKEIDISWENSQDVQQSQIAERKGLSGHTIPRPAGHLNNHLVWLPQWGWKTPRGYSTLVTHPLNRFDLPFTTMSAVVDSDKYFTGGNIPFFIKEDFEGLYLKALHLLKLFQLKEKNGFQFLIQHWLNLQNI